MRRADRFRHLRREALFWGVAVLIVLSSTQN